MQANEIIAIMRSRGWLRKEPQKTREKVTSAVRYMMVKNHMTNAELAQELTNPSGVQTVYPSYIRRKLSEHRWRLEDLDELPDILGREVSDYVGGYRRMAQIDDEEHQTAAEEQDHE